PPRRYLLGIYAKNGQDQKAARMLRQLRAIEPSFNIDTFLGDPNYPISLLRRQGMIDRARLCDLAYI
ncbi:MAG: hypothetical protein AAFY25_09960, partial [Pseudomonadota bacterium]